MTQDVLVVGGGPAGWATAAACTEAGLGVTLVDPDPDAQWPANYGVWEDEALALGAESVLGRRWKRPQVHLGTEPLVLPRTYAQVDKLALRRWLTRRATGVEVLAGRVLDASHDAEGTVVRLERGALRARVVVDASGHAPVLVERHGRPTAAQVAWGVLAEVPDYTGEMWLMDFRQVGEGPPTFLYALPMGDGTVFLEETTLAARPPLPMEALQARLERRLAAMGLTLGPILETERCYIPMDAPQPRLDQRVVAIGGAAGLVHPASGYLLATSLRTAPVLAEALAGALSEGPAAMALAGWQAVWPRERQRQWAVYRFGLEILLTLDLRATQDFFAAFFQLEPERWGGFLSGTLPPMAQADVMWTMMIRADAATRRRLIGSGLTPPGLRAMAALAGW